MSPTAWAKEQALERREQESHLLTPGHHLAVLSLTTITAPGHYPLPKQLSAHLFIQLSYFLGTAEETKQISCPQAVMSNQMFLTWSKAQGQE